jgi:hypothetical protein
MSAANPANAATKPAASAVDRKEWRKEFRTLAELDQGPVPMLIEHILPAEGVMFIGSLSGVGKTWIALSMVKALRTGKPLLSHYRVPEVVPVAYLVPEMGSRAIRNRIEKLGIPSNEDFLLRTLKEGVMQLDSPYLEAMVQELKPVLFLDTAIRFTAGAEENSASANAVGLADAVFRLLRLGARAVVCLHHSPKASGNQPVMTLENILRGTGDFGAMCEVVWGVERARRKQGNKWDYAYAKESESLTRLRVECLKGRDIPDVADPFVVQGRPYIDERGDFAVVRQGDLDLEPSGRSVEERIKKLVGMVTAEPKTSIRSLSRATGWNNADVKRHALGQGWKWMEGKGWVNGEPETVAERVISGSGAPDCDAAPFPKEMGASRQAI